MLSKVGSYNKFLFCLPRVDLSARSHACQVVNLLSMCNRNDQDQKLPFLYLIDDSELAYPDFVEPYQLFTQHFPYLWGSLRI